MTDRERTAADVEVLANASGAHMVDQEVEIVGTPMAGSVGTIISYLEEKGRWKVMFASGVSKNFKPESLRNVRSDKRWREEDGSQTSSGLRPRVGSAVSSILLMLRSEEPRNGDDSSRTATPVMQPSRHHSVNPQFTVAPTVNVAGRSFSKREELVCHVRKMQARVEQAVGNELGILEGEDSIFMFHLLKRHPKTADKLRAPLKVIRYGLHTSFPKAKCFIMSFTDGTEEAVGWMKCVKELFAHDPVSGREKALDEACPPRPSKRARAVEETPQVCERSRSDTGLKLIREEASLKGVDRAGSWEYPLMDENRRCFAGYLRCPVARDVVRRFFDTAKVGTIWTRPTHSVSGEPIPRNTAWMVAGDCTCAYRYGGVDVQPQRFPQWMITVMETYMPYCGLDARDTWPDCCNLNFYEDGGMSVGWHADNEKFFQGRVDDMRIISLSMGDTRIFELRTADTEGQEERAKCSVSLHDGDLCTMEGLTQKHYQHRVPKEVAAGPRINLTWRWMRWHKAGCPHASDKV
eukprot:CAMPEP_0194514394 /NCGR_PEP_ID=MMETSP0253-20130528/46842_1 /TAXON_ID=2966 /ORGANISM="Noctiluca scintillans" /LENGTH=520 /DNA_ID=CAMNT_0039358049 /DNA_START=38 /DNA_END=1600 /DNA_ORIENTATION=-